MVRDFWTNHGAKLSNTEAILDYSIEPLNFVFNPITLFTIYGLSCNTLLTVHFFQRNPSQTWLNTRCFSSCHKCETENFWVLTRNQTTDLRIPRFDALPLSHRWAGPIQGSYEKRVPQTARPHIRGEAFYNNSFALHNLFSLKAPYSNSDCYVGSFTVWVVSALNLKKTNHDNEGIY